MSIDSLHIHFHHVEVMGSSGIFFFLVCSKVFSMSAFYFDVISLKEALASPNLLKNVY